MSKVKKQEFVSNVTGEEWFKHSSVKWHKVIHQVGIILEDETHMGKNNVTTTLKKGSKVIIDDIRGRIKPQYRVKDMNGKIWFVSALNIEILEDTTKEVDITEHEYRGGVRHDGSNAASHRYTVDKTTEEELQEIKEEKKKSNA